MVFSDLPILDAAVEGVVDFRMVQPGSGLLCRHTHSRRGGRGRALRGVAAGRRLAKLRTGDPLQKSTDVGRDRPSGTTRTHPRARGNRALRKGAGAASGRSAGRLLLPATLVTNVHPASVLSTEEIFGPVVTLTPFRTPEDAVSFGKQHALRARRFRLDRKHQSRDRHRSKDEGGGGVV